MSRWHRGLVAIALALTLGSASPAGAGAVPCLAPPVSGTVQDPFRAPACPYCAGNRGIEYASAPDLAVVAAADGRVSFAGLVAGVRYVVLEHPGGFRTTYGRLARAEVRVGERLARGDRLGTSGSATFFGLRSGDDYLDPAPFLGTVVPRPQLVPLDGHHRRPPPPGELVCPS